MDVYWTEPAEAHLRAIHAALSHTSVRYANRMVDRITERTKQIAEFPRSGATVPHAEALEIRMILERRIESSMWLDRAHRNSRRASRKPGHDLEGRELVGEADGAFEGVGGLDDAGLIEEVADDLKADGEAVAEAAGEG